MPIDPKIMSKIQKLLALAGEGGLTQDNIHEADAAMKMAGKLMAEHGIAIADVSMEHGKSSVNINDFKMREASFKMRKWARQLAHCLCTIFDCRLILVKDNEQVLIGAKTDLDLVLWYYKFLKIRIARQASHKFRLVEDQKTYGLGCVMSLKMRLTKMFVAPQKEVETTDVRALIVVKNDAVQAAVTKKFPILGHTARPTHNGSTAAYIQGMQDGHTMSINQSIENNG